MKIPRDLSGDRLASKLRKLGYQVIKQKGSHLRLTTRKEGTHRVVNPRHSPITLTKANL